MSTEHDDDDEPRLDRRRLLQTSGLTVALGALVAACSETVEGEPGRVGYAPPITPLPTVEENDVVYLRTATSIEQMLVETYGAIREDGVLEGQAATVLDRLVEDHEDAVATTSELTTDAGGEPYECANSWYVERIVTPILARVQGDPSQDIPPSDDPARDTLVVVNAMESMAAAMYQQMVELLTEPDLRAEVMLLGATAARHAAAVAILATGAPDGYVDPALAGAEVEPDETGLTPIFAVPTQFGSLAPLSLTIGAPNEAGTRFTTGLETPAANAFVYEDQRCDA